MLVDRRNRLTRAAGKGYKGGRDEASVGSSDANDARRAGHHHHRYAFISGKSKLCAFVELEFCDPPLLPPEEVSGEITDVRIDSGAGYVTVNFEAEVWGFKNEELPVTWTLFEATSRSKVPNEAWHDILALRLKPTHDRDQGTHQFQVPHTGTIGQWYVRLELHPPNSSEAPLDYVDSEIFSTTY